MSYNQHIRGGNQQPMIIDIYNKSTNGTDVSGTIRASYHKNGERNVVENLKNGKGYEGVIVAMRGRNPENPSDRTPGIETEQRLEPNTQGTSNTLTSVQKDNLVLEKVKINQPTQKGFVECAVGGVADLSYITSKTRRGRVQEDGSVCPTLCAEEKDICRIEAGDEDCYTLAYEDGEYIYYIRIRKLIPLECWRLMGFSDEDFLKAAAVNSNTQLYKQAGNSIVKNCLVAIIGQFFEGCEEKYKET